MKKVTKKAIAIALALVLLMPAFRLFTQAGEDEIVYETYTAFGDSIGYGYLIAGEPTGEYELVQDHYYNAPQTAFPALLGKKVSATTVYNMSSCGLWGVDFAATLLDPTYVSLPIYWIDIAMSDRYTGEGGEEKAMRELAYHQLFVNAIKQSDLISLEFGGNDVLQGMLTYVLFGHAFNEDGSVKNGVMAALLLSLLEEAYGEELAAYGFGDYSEYITVESVMEFISFFTEDTLLKEIYAYSDALAEAYKTAYKVIKYGTELTEEQYQKFIAAYAAADIWAETASDTPKAAGAMSDKDVLLNGRADVFVGEDGKYYMAPLNPMADVLMLGLYNPYMDNDGMTEADWTELYSFFGKGLNIAMRYLMGPAEIYSVPTPSMMMQWRSRWMPYYGVWKNSYQRAKADMRAYNFYKKQWIHATTEIYNAVEEDWKAGLQEDLNEMLSDLPYAFMYTLLGLPTQEIVSYHNTVVETAAAEVHAPFVSLTGMKSARQVDPHPNAEGHAYIAEMMYAILEDPNAELLLALTRPEKAPETEEEKLSFIKHDPDAFNAMIALAFADEEKQKLTGAPEEHNIMLTTGAPEEHNIMLTTSAPATNPENPEIAPVEPALLTMGAPMKSGVMNTACLTGTPDVLVADNGEEKGMPILVSTQGNDADTQKETIVPEGSAESQGENPAGNPTEGEAGEASLVGEGNAETPTNPDVTIKESEKEGKQESYGPANNGSTCEKQTSIPSWIPWAIAGILAVIILIVLVSGNGKKKEK